MAGEEATGENLSVEQVDVSASAAATPAPRSRKAAAQPAEEAPAQPAEETPAVDADAALVERLQMQLTTAGAPAVELAILLRDEKGGGVVRLEAKDRHVVRTAASALLHSGDGREWKYLGDGPAGEEENLSAAYLSANPLA